MKKLLIIIVVSFVGLFVISAGLSFSKYLKEQNELEKKLEKYEIGELVTIADIDFYVSSKSEGKLELIAKENIGRYSFSKNKYSIEYYVERFVDKIEDKGYKVEDFGILSKYRIEELCNKVTIGVDYKYNCHNQDFIAIDEDYWIDGFDTGYPEFFYYYNGDGMVGTESKKIDHGIRPVIKIMVTELDK